MKSTKMDPPFFYSLRLEQGEELFSSLRTFFEREGLNRAFVLSTIGSLRRVVVNYPETNEIPPKVGKVTLEGLFEINGISGEIWRKGPEIRIHLHGSITERGKSVYGGGFTERAEVLYLAEVFIAGVK